MDPRNDRRFILCNDDGRCLSHYRYNGPCGRKGEAVEYYGWELKAATLAIMEATGVPVTAVSSRSKEVRL